MQVVILCGGSGTRSYPFTEYFPKPMMPVCGKPILVHIMRLYAQQGFKHFVLAAGHRLEVLQDYFEGRFNDWDVQIVDTGSDGDTGDRIRRCGDRLDGTFFATYGDGVGDVRLHDLLAFNRRSGGLATLTSVPLRSQYGTVVADRTGKVSEFHEKPVIREYWINAGFFVFEKRAFDFWEGHNLENEVFPALVRLGLLHTYRHEGFWKSMDTSKDQQELERLYLRGEARWSVETNGAPDSEPALSVQGSAPDAGSGKPDGETGSRP